jgi:hypothetical protein
MGSRQGLVRLGQRVVALVATVLLMWGTVSCSKPTEPTQLMSEPAVEPNRLTGQLSEVSPPESIQLLKQVIDAYTPQVRILSPRPGEIVEDTSVSLRMQVRGLPLFKDATWLLGPHLHVFLDNEPYQAVYDVSEPLEFKDLAPGTHTLRVFASRPWHESFKNQGAFDQRTFHIYAPTPQNELSADQPLLTYSRPQGSYGAEPIMLDFYLANAPLHMTAQADPVDDIHDWRIRCTVNGQSFVFDQWQSIYLKGFKPGRNWVQLELIDEAGKPIDNRFNNTVRIIDYEPGGEDTLSKLVRGELQAKEVAGIIDPTYVPPAQPEPEAEPEEIAPESKAVAPEPAVAPAETTPEPGDEEMISPEPVAPDPVVPLVTPESPGTRVPDSSVPKVDGQDIPGAPPQEVVPQAEMAPAPEEPTGESPSESGAPTTESALSAPAPEPGAIEELKLPDGLPALSPELLGESEQEGPDQAQPPGTDRPGTDGIIKAEDQGIEPLGVEILNPAETGPQGNEQPRPITTPEPADAVEPEAPAVGSTGNQLLERYRQWQRRRSQSMMPSAPEQVTPDDGADPVEVYLSPTPKESPEANRPDEPDGDSVRMDMPDLVEPYLTEPYLTEPRLDLSPSEAAPAKEQEEEPEPQPQQLPDDDEPGAEPSPPAMLERPFI